MRCVLLRVAAQAACVSLLCLLFSNSALASPDFGGNCGRSSCHGGNTGVGQADTTPASTTKLPGDLVTFTMNVTNGSGGTAAFTGKPNTASPLSGTQALTAITGTANVANLLVVTPDVATAAAWTAQGNYYINPGSGSSFTKTFSFVIPANTPADTYVLSMKVAGSGGSGEWSSTNPLSLTVGAVPEPATLAMVLGGALVGFICWRGRKRLARS
jgi:hypothetical protein